MLLAQLRHSSGGGQSCRLQHSLQGSQFAGFAAKVSVGVTTCMKPATVALIAHPAPSEILLSSAPSRGHNRPPGCSFQIIKWCMVMWLDAMGYG